jgi:single-strand DNA-binding protein
MRGYNKVFLIGNAGGAPEVRTTQGGSTVANFSLATSREYKDHAGVKQTVTQWHRIVAWEGLAEVVGKYVGKGSRVFIEGAVEYRKWQDKDGVTRYSTEINARELYLLGEPKGAATGNGARNAPGLGMDEAPPLDDYPSEWDEPLEPVAPLRETSKPAAKKSTAKRSR